MTMPGDDFAPDSTPETVLPDDAEVAFTQHMEAATKLAKAIATDYITVETLATQANDRDVSDDLFAAKSHLTQNQLSLTEAITGAIRSEIITIRSGLHEA